MSGLPCCIGEADVEPDWVDPHPAAAIDATREQRAAYVGLANCDHREGPVSVV